MSEDFKQIIDKKIESQENWETKQNLLGFFGLLLEIDKRNNPEKYKNNENNGNTNSPD